MQQLRKRAERDALIEDMLEFGVAARDRVAYYDEVWLWFEIFRIEWLGHRDTEVAEEIRHRWIGSGIGTGYAMSSLLEHSG